MVTPGKPKLLKLRNRAAVLGLFRNAGNLTVAEISDRLKISKTTIIKILDYLLRTGIILTPGKGPSTVEGGKRPMLFKFNGRYRYAIGHHIEPKGITSVITDLKGTILNRISSSFDQDQDQDLDGVLQTIVHSTGELLEQSKIEPSLLLGIGVGLPGIVDFHTGVLRYSPWFSSWGNEIDFSERLKLILGFDIPVFIDNESRFQVLAEKLAGVANNRRNIVAIDGGEGLVAGIIVIDELKRGVHHLAGEIGHMIINPADTKPCICGSRGCFEAQVYQSRLLKDAKAAYPDHQDSLIFKGLAIEEVSVEMIFESANNGDKLARELVDNIIRWYAIACSNIIMMIDPELIVIQGIYARAGAYFLDNLKQQVNHLVLPHIKKDVEIQYSNLGSDACVIGACLFIISEYFKHQFHKQTETDFLKAAQSQ